MFIITKFTFRLKILVDLLQIKKCVKTFRASFNITQVVVMPHVKTHQSTAPLASEIITRTKFHVASSVKWLKIINSICRLSEVVCIFDMPASAREPRPRRESGSTSPSSTWLPLIRRDAGEDVRVVLMLTDSPL